MIQPDHHRQSASSERLQALRQPSLEATNHNGFVNAPPIAVKYGELGPDTLAALQMRERAAKEWVSMAEWLC